MTDFVSSKHKYWHREWQVQDGRLVHTSGLAFAVTLSAGTGAAVSLCRDSLSDFNRREMARGVAPEDLSDRLGRLQREALRWAQRNQSRL